MSASQYMDICERLSRDLWKAEQEIDRLRCDRDLEKKIRKDVEHQREDLAEEVARLRNALAEAQRA